MPPISAVSALVDRATLSPQPVSAATPLPAGTRAGLLQLEPDRVLTHTAPASFSPFSPSVLGPPMSAVLPSPESATLQPCKRPLDSGLPMSASPCCFHLPSS